MASTEKEQTVKVWAQHPGVEAARTVEYLESLEKDGWTIFQVFHTNEMIKQKTNVLNLNPNQHPAMILVIHALCYKFIKPE